MGKDVYTVRKNKKSGEKQICLQSGEKHYTIILQDPNKQKIIPQEIYDHVNDYDLVGSALIEINDGIKPKYGEYISEDDIKSIEYLLVGYKYNERMITRINANLVSYYKGIYEWIKIEQENQPHKDSDSLNFAEVRNEGHNAGRFYSEKMDLLKYTVRMCYGYTACYYTMFNSFFKEIFPVSKKERINIHVVSIGCGIKSDALAMKYAIRESGYSESIGKLKYVGIDAGAWGSLGQLLLLLNSEDEFLEIENAPQNTPPKEYYIDKDIEKLNDLKQQIDAFDKEDGQSFFFIVFPNSISEMDEGGITKLFEQGIKKVYEGKKTYIFISRNPLGRDCNNEICDVRDRLDEKQALTIKNMCGDPMLGRVSKNSEQEVEWEKHTVEEFLPEEYTGNVKDFIDDIMKDDRYLLGEWPIKKSRYIQYEVFKLFEGDQL